MVIYARVVAVPVNFPSELELRYETLDEETGEPIAVFGSPAGSPDYYSWEDLRRKFSIGEALASECEALLRQGENALIAQAQEWEDDWEPGIGFRKMRDESKPGCSFCGKSHDTVGKLIASSIEPGAYICDQCVAVMSSIIQERRI